jgi:Fe-S-cluster-containing hydrogenase components 2
MARKKLDKILMISPDKCIGCRSCELICSFGKTKAFNPKQSAVSVLSYDEAAISVPMMCMQCEEPSCLKICPVGAIAKNDDGAVVIDEKKCIVCKLCVSACPLGNISFDASERKLIKCNLCGGEPKCEQFCPSGAIQYREGTAVNLNRKKLIGEKLKDLFGEVNG